jgi:hypothetical protein
MADLGDGPLDHLPREMPPWNTGPALTECGRPVADVKSVTTREAIKAKVEREGKRRASFSTCMACADTSDRYLPWVTNAASIVERWCRGAWRQKYNPSENGNRQQRELLALGMLVEEHREEFEGLVESLSQTTDLAAVRRRARLRAVRPS